MKLILDFIGVAFELLLAYLFFRIFFERWRFSKKVVLIFFIGIFFLKLSSSYYLANVWQKTVLSFICYLLLACCYKGNIFRKAIMALFFLLVSVVAEYGVHVTLMILAGKVYAVGGHQLQDYAIGLFLSKFILMMLYSFLYFYQRDRHAARQELSYKWYAAFLIYPIVTIIILMQNYYFILETADSASLDSFICTSILLMLSNLVIFKILDEMQRLQAIKLEAELSEQRLLIQEAHYAELVQKNHTVKKYIHDTKNFLLALQGYIQEGKSNVALEELQQMLKTLQMDLIECTGNIVLDTVLSNKIHIAQSKNITLIPAIALYGDVKIKIIDLALILGNALDNAIEAAEAVTQTTEKKIWLTMKLQQDILHIQVKNPVMKKVLIQNQTIVSGKKEQEMHGFGISNMKTITKKYRGTFDMQCSDKLFVLNIVLENEEAG